MSEAKHLVAVLLDETDYSDPLGRDYAQEREVIKRELAIQRRKELKDEERRAGLETERQMADEERLKAEREAAEGTVLHGSDEKKARDYFRDPNRKRWPKMREVKVGSVTGQELPGKPSVPSLQIKGRKEYQPGHYTMPAPWKNWR